MSFIILLLSVVPLVALEYQAQLSPTQAYIGDILEFTFHAEFSVDREILYLQEESATLPEFRILDIKEERNKKGGKIQYSLNMKVACFDTAWQSFGPRKFVLKDSTKAAEEWERIVTDSQYVYINSLLDSLSGNIPDQYGPENIAALSRQQLFILAILLLAALAALYFALKKRRFVRPEVVETAETAEKQFLRELDELHDKKLIYGGRFKDFYEELGYILKTYFENLFFIHLKELSSRETLPVVQEYLDDEVLKQYRHFLDQGDLVKYAGHEAGINMCEEALEWAKSLPGLIDKKTTDENYS